MKKILKSFFLQGLFYVLFFGLIVLIFALFDMGLRWDNLNRENLDVIAYVCLIAFRLIIYILPGILMWLFLRKKQKISKCYSIQFCWYSILLALFNIFSLDYIWKIEIFSKLDSFVFLLGFVLSLVLNKKLPNDATNKFENK